MAKRYFGSQGSYAGMESRRSQERQDGGMISEDKSAIANLPQNVMIKPYPAQSYETYGLNDTITSINHQQKADLNGGKKKSGGTPEMY